MKVYKTACVKQNKSMMMQLEDGTLVLKQYGASVNLWLQLLFFILLFLLDQVFQNTELDSWTFLLLPSPATFFTL